MISAISRSARRLQGRVRVPGDKSISHRALILGALALGETTADGLLEGEDVLATARAMRALGAGVERLEGSGGAGGAPPRWRVRGNGMGALTEPQGVLDLGNSGTGARLLAGVLAAQPFTSVLSGDESLSRRPMDRVTEPLTQMGARFETRSGGRLPMTIMGARMSARALLPVEYTSPVASAQVKSAMLLAGLHAPGETTVIEPAPSRDHTERMLRHFGAEVRTEARSGGALAVTVTGEAELAGAHVKVPGDPSSAAFALAAGLLADEGAVTAEGVSANPLRSGFLDTLLEMGADLTFENVREEAGEPVHDVTARPSKLRGVQVPAERAPAMIDEYPVLAVLAAFADGETRMNGLAELRVKESDRIAAVIAGLRANGADAQDGPDWMAVGGTGARPSGGGTVTTHLDHRIAMAFLVMGMGAEAPVTVDDITPVATSFPGFAELMNSLGAGIEAD